MLYSRLVVPQKLGALDPVEDFNPLADLPSGVALSTFASAFVCSPPRRRACSPSIRSPRPTGSWRRVRPAASSLSRFEDLRRTRGVGPVAVVNLHGRGAPYTTITQPMIPCLWPCVKGEECRPSRP
jgi:hypothetical protein